MIETQYLANVMGIFALLQGATRLSKRDAVMTLYREMPKNRPLAFVLGSMLTMFGSGLVVGHFVFRDSLTTLVSLFGCGMMLDGCVFLFLPSNHVKGYVEALERPGVYFSFAIGFLILGVLLFTLPMTA